MDDDSETPTAKRARLHDSASSSNSEESDTTHYEDDNIFDDDSQEKVYYINEPSEESHNGFSERLIARDATSEIGSSFRYGSPSRGKVHSLKMDSLMNLTFWNQTSCLRRRKALAQDVSLAMD